MNIYDRQESLKLDLPRSATVVGVGGAGSWVALFLALSGVEKLVLIDPDRVEETNLNRTPFRFVDVGEYKVCAMASLIAERRPTTDVLPFARSYRNRDGMGTEIVFDCRDVLNPLDEVAPVIKLGYDGGSRITIIVNPQFDELFGDGPSRYDIVPSWVAPAALCGVVAAILAARGDELGTCVKKIQLDQLV